MQAALFPVRRWLPTNSQWHDLFAEQQQEGVLPLFEYLIPSIVKTDVN